MCGARCVKGEKTRMHNGVLVFLSFRDDCSELKNEKTRMHNVILGPTSSRLAGNLPGWLEFLPG